MNINPIFAGLSLLVFAEIVAFRVRISQLSGFRFYRWGLIGYAFFSLLLIALFWLPSSSVRIALIAIGVIGEGLTRLWETYQESKTAVHFPRQWQTWTSLYQQTSFLQRLLLFPKFEPIDKD